MRGLGTLIVLLVILAALGGYIFFVERNRDPLRSTSERAFGEIAADDIEEIEIRSADGETSRLQKSGTEWALVEPVRTEANQSEVLSIASSLSSVNVQRVVDENPSDLKQYGLEPARIEIAFRRAGETAFRRLLLGERTPTGGDLYARLAGEPRVFLVSSFLDSTFNKNAFALRDRRILRVERDKVDGLELTEGSRTLRFAKSGSEWRIVSPIAARADYGAVEGAVERLSSAQMQSIVTAEGGPARQYGLDRPVATMTILAGSSKATLTLGRTENALVFAQDQSRPMIFTVAPTLRTDVLKDVSEFRRKDLFDSRSFTATRVELRRGASVTILEKSKVEDRDVWKDAEGRELETDKVDDLLAKLTNLRAQSFEPGTHAALRSPVLTAAVRFGDGSTETVAFGRAGDEVVAARSDEPGTAKLEAAGFDEAIAALDALE